MHQGLLPFFTIHHIAHGIHDAVGLGVLGGKTIGESGTDAIARHAGDSTSKLAAVDTFGLATEGAQGEIMHRPACCRDIYSAVSKKCSHLMASFNS